MEKTFKYKDIEITVRTNLLMEDECYFGANIQEEIENGFKEATFGKGIITFERLIIGLNDYLVSVGIKAKTIKYKNLVHEGAVMTETGPQTTL